MGSLVCILAFRVHVISVAMVHGNIRWKSVTWRVICSGPTRLVSKHKFILCSKLFLPEPLTSFVRPYITSHELIL